MIRELVSAAMVAVSVLSVVGVADLIHSLVVMCFDAIAAVNAALSAANLQ